MRELVLGPAGLRTGLWPRRGAGHRSALRIEQGLRVDAQEQRDHDQRQQAQPAGNHHRPAGPPTAILDVVALTSPLPPHGRTPVKLSSEQPSGRRQVDRRTKGTIQCNRFRGGCKILPAARSILLLGGNTRENFCPTGAAVCRISQSRGRRGVTGQPAHAATAEGASMTDWTVEPGGLPRSRAADERVLARDAELLDALPDDGSMGDERERLRWLVERLSYWMDAWFEVPGTGLRFGLDPLVGLLPGIGDAVSTVVSLYIISLAGRCGLPRITLARMSLNVLIDMLLGAVPLVGDVFDVWWKANQKNAKLLAARVPIRPSPAAPATATGCLWA